MQQDITLAEDRETKAVERKVRGRDYLLSLQAKRSSLFPLYSYL
jgi:hypothetical protein